MNDKMIEALLADGEKLRQLTGEDHGPWGLCDVCSAFVSVDCLVMDINGFERLLCDDCRKSSQE